MKTARVGGCQGPVGSCGQPDNSEYPEATGHWTSAWIPMEGRRNLVPLRFLGAEVSGVSRSCDVCVGLPKEAEI